MGMIENLMSNKILKEKLGEILGEKMSSIFKTKIKDTGLIKFSWTFEVVNDELICTKIIQQFEQGDIKVSEPHLNVKEFIMDVMKGQK